MQQATHKNIPQSAVRNLDFVACVQYGYPSDSDRPTREPRLRTIFDPIPDGASTVSPIYVLTNDQYKRNCKFDNPYAVKGPNPIATVLQNECEKDERDGSVLYPLYAESDAFLQDGSELFEWIADFGGETLGVESPEEACTWFFSGSRSIHAHFPRFVKGKHTLEQIREGAKDFNEENGADIDVGIYTRKRLFRLPNVVHRETDLKKTRINYGSERGEITNKCIQNDNKVPNTFEEVLRDVFLPSVGSDYDPLDFFNVVDSENTLIDTRPASESENVSEKRPDWYDNHPFSPYALASGGNRSVGIFRIEGNPYGSRQERKTLLPVFTYGAVGCTGEFRRSDYYSPLLLSNRDYWKVEGFETGTIFVIIGARNRDSKTFEVTKKEAHEASTLLMDESRQDALEFLREAGYDVGSAGKTKDNYSRLHEDNISEDSDSSNTLEEGDDEESKAAKLQRRAERDDFGSLHHNEKISVACRLLYRGKEFTHNWIRQNMDAYDYDITEDFLTGLIEQYPDDYLG